MVDEEKVLYTPEIAAKKDYRWDGEYVFSPTVEQETASAEEKTETEAEEKQRKTAEIRHEMAEDIVEKGKVLREIIKEYIPETITNPVVEIIDWIEIIIDDIKDKEPVKDPEPTVIEDIMPPVSPQNWTPDTTLPPEIVADIRNGDLEELVPNTVEYPVAVHAWPNFADTAHDVMNQELLDVKELFMNELQFLLIDFMNQLLQLRQEIGFSSLADILKPMDAEYVDVSDPQLYPLRDMVVRSQIERNQRSRLFRKTHNIDNTIFHMRATRAANEQWARALTASIVDENDMADAAMNEFVLKSRDEYAQRYRSAMYGYSKYLNGALPVLGSVLGAMVDEAKAKAKLLKSGVNIYATKDTAALPGNNTSGANTKPAVTTTAAVTTTEPVKTTTQPTTTTSGGNVVSPTTAPAASPAVNLPTSTPGYRGGGSLW